MSRTTLRELMEKGPVIAPCVYDCLSARMVELSGFEAMCLSGAEVAAAYLGLPDIGLVTMAELEDNVRRISASSPLPMIVDIDTGFGNELNTILTCRRIAAAGAMAVHLEDQTFPKRCGHMTGKQVIPFEDYISKIRAAADALKGTDCMLIARTDAFNVLGKEEAIRRANAAMEAGADCALVEGTETLEAIEDIGRRVRGWKMFGMSSAGASPKVTAQQLIDWGYNLITLHYAQWAAMAAMKEFGEKCFQTKDDIFVTEDPRVDNRPIALFEMFGLHDWLQLGEKYSDKIKDAGEYRKA